ncbi:indole-3-glycerol phosphate synthase TrpC [uncultured Clostridium sp.]|uniref:indole-3-glycerol phosphate synthase TrpC n=1 Tax=uncultured Clostridium sp. TaxID=59620 RepID=UPI00262CFF9A|nr:indole-3-glycerol phosphate synthase TrpC [uncultured Clostridium sp.]
MYLEPIINEKERLLKESKKIGKFKERIRKEGISIIGEYKKASPVKGIILKDYNVNEIFDFYNEISVDCFSVLTEEKFFQGSNSDLIKIKERSNIPILRKDFIIDKYQIYESKVIGADAILLIASVLGRKLEKFYSIANSIGLDTVIEVHTEDELKYALDCDAEIIGINNRDLDTFKVNLKTTEKLLKRIPKGKLVISESGVGGICDIEHLSNLGVDGVLVGELFMKNLKNEYFKVEFKKFRGKGLI